MIICVVRMIYGNHLTFSTSTVNIKLPWFGVSYGCYANCFKWYLTRFFDFFHHISNKFFGSVFEPIRNVFVVFSVCFIGWNIFLDIARTYLKQKSKGKYVIYVILNLHQRILKTWFFAKTRMSSSTKFQSGYFKSRKGECFDIWKF